MELIRLSKFDYERLAVLLEPPFYWSTAGRNDTVLFNHRNMAITKLPNSVPMFEDVNGLQLVKAYISTAIQEKYERDFTKLRWIDNSHKIGCYYKCPKCECEVVLYKEFCHDCGQRLLPPEGEGK